MPLIQETDVATPVKDFALFCGYICQHKPKLTRARSELGKKVCYEINSLLSKPRVVDSAKYLQPVYFTVHLFFHIALATGLFVKEFGKNGSVYLVPNGKLADYQQLNTVSQYLFLFRSYWTALDYSTIYQETGAVFGHFIYVRIGLETLKNRQPGEKIVAEIETAYDSRNPLHRFFVSAGPMIYHFAAFGFWDDVEEVVAGVFFGRRKDDPNIKALTLTQLGVTMIPACLERPYELYNQAPDIYLLNSMWHDSSILTLINQLAIQPVTDEQNPVSFEAAFVKIFPPSMLETTKIAALFQAPETPVDLGGNVYLLKIIYKAKRWRSVKLAATHTLGHLHQAIQDAFDFADDHLYAFFMSEKPWTGQAYLSPYAEESPNADEAPIGRLGLRRGQRFIYLFDFGDAWQFTVQVEDVLYSEAPPVRPLIVASLGEAPEQYPDFFPDEDE